MSSWDWWWGLSYGRRLILCPSDSVSILIWYSEFSSLRLIFSHISLLQLVQEQSLYLICFGLINPSETHVVYIFWVNKHLMCVNRILTIKRYSQNFPLLVSQVLHSRIESGRIWTKGREVFLCYTNICKNFFPKLLLTLTFSLTLLMRRLISLSCRIVSNFSSSVFRLTVSNAFEMSIIIITRLYISDVIEV